MPTVTEAITLLDELLAPDGWEDYGPNGLQVPGERDLGLVVTGVSAHLELFERAAEEGAGLVVCHHGLFWDFHPRSLSATMKRRLQVLFDGGMALAAYHLPLDAHPAVGNNALICAGLGLERAEPFGMAKGRAIGWVGRSAEGIPVAGFVERCRALFGQEPLVQGAGPDTVRSVGVVSGSGASMLGDAATAGLDALLTGEPAEHAMADAREARLHFLACGHYATETLGVRCLGDLLARELGVEHRFVDVPNPV